MKQGLRDQYLAAIGIERWERRCAASAAPDHSIPANFPPAPAPAPPAVVPEKTSEAPLDWSALQAAVSRCMRCGLHATRTQTVFGVGDPQADWFFVGEAPGAEEDRQGEPFVGRAGQLLNAMLAALGLQREQVYIANVLKCRPPNNRDPAPAEIECCEPFLLRQIELIRPRIIVALGRFAAHSLLRTELPLTKLRGRALTYHDTPLVVTYHPAYLLRNPVDKRRAWDDLCLARSVAART